MRAAKRGFILLYVAAMLALIGVLLLQMDRLQSPSPRFIERQIAHVLQRSEQQMLLEFVLAGTHPQKLTYDPRYEQFRRMLLAAPRPPSEMEEQVAWLKAALAEFGISMADRDPEAAAMKKAEAMKDAGEILFTPRKDPYVMKLGQTEYKVSVLPGNAFPNLNSISYEALVRALAQLKIPERETKELAAALIDWRDADEFRTDGIGAESDYYQGLPTPYPPRNAPIRAWQELTYVRGMTPERVRLLREYFILAPVSATGLSIDFGSIDAFAALTGMVPERVRELMRAYGKLADKNAPVESILLTREATEFEKVAALESDLTVLRIRIHSADSDLSADYEYKARRLIAVW